MTPPAQLTLVSHGAPTALDVRTSRRDGYFDLLRALALVQIIVVNVVPFVWYPATFPALGMTFAIGGSLLAGSLDASPHRPLPVIKRSLLRLLAPLWAMAAILVPTMLALGWTSTEGGQPLEPVSLLTWVLPISPPPVSDLGYQLAMPYWMWALSCYLWMLLLSPALLWLYRRWPKRTLAVPLTVLLLNALGVVPLADDNGDVVLRLATFGVCLLLGFAHHDGRLERVRLGTTLALGGFACAVGVACAHAFAPGDGPVPDETPLAYGFLSIGLVLVLLRFHPYVHGRFGSRLVVRNLLAAVTDRAMTIFLWGHVCVSLSLYLIQVASAEPWWPALPELAWPAMTLVLSAVLLLVCAAVLGWVEDKGAGRSARINPWPRAMSRPAQSAVSGPA